MRPINRDLRGQRFGRLAVEDKKVVRDREKWQCKCDCGKTAYVAEVDLLRGHTKSCGCLRKELARARGKTNGRFLEAEYVAWTGMIARASGVRNRSPYVVDPAWLESYEVFYNDLGPRPTRKHRLSRVVPELGYVRGNCIWKGPIVYPGGSDS